MKSRSKSLALAVMAVLFAGTLFVPRAFAAYSVSHQVSDAANFTNITNTGLFGVTSAEWAGSVEGGDNIQFNLRLVLVANPGAQPWPQSITYGITATTGPDVPQVYFGGNPVNTTFTETFTTSNYATPRTIQVNIIAPAGDGAYTVKIFPTAQTGSTPKLNDAQGITIGFTVSNPTGCTPAATSLSLVVDPSCVIYRANSTTFTATLTSGGGSLAGKWIDFTIEGNDLPSVVTDGNGQATLTYDPSGLPVGDYTVTASFQSDDVCYLDADPSIASLGVKYDFLGFQPPVQIDGVGAGLFSGKVIPVKIKIADALGMPVPDATAYITWTGTMANVSYTDAPAESVSAADSGNLMRYSLDGNQYIYNWDVSMLDNGPFTINIDMGEGCSADHNATVILQKSSGKKK